MTRKNWSLSVKLTVYGCQLFEVEALKRVTTWLPADSVVTVPKVHFFDQDMHIIIMDDCGSDAIMLKQLMQENKVSPVLAEMIGTSLGQFLGTLHKWGKDASLLQFFDANEQAKKMSAWVTYGRLVSTLSGKDNLPALNEPPLAVPEEKLSIISKLADETSREMTSKPDTASLYQST